MHVYTYIHTYTNIYIYIYIYIYVYLRMPVPTYKSFDNVISSSTPLWESPIMCASSMMTHPSSCIRRSCVCMCMYVCMYVCVSTSLGIANHVCLIYDDTSQFMYTSFLCVYVCMHVCVYVFVCVGVNLFGDRLIMCASSMMTHPSSCIRRSCVCVCMYVSMYIYIFVCVCVHIHTCTSLLSNHAGYTYMYICLCI